MVRLSLCLNHRWTKVTYMVATESLQEWLGTFGVHKEISNDGGQPPAFPPSWQLEECTRDSPLHITQSNWQFLHPNNQCAPWPPAHCPTVQLCLTILPWLMPWLPHIPAPKTLPLLLGTWVSNHVPSAPSPSHHSGQPAPIDQSHRYGRPQAACREPAGSYDKTTRTAICFEHKTQYLLIRAPYTRIVVFWHISTISPMISQSQISCNTPTVYIAAIFVKYCYTTASWLL